MRIGRVVLASAVGMGATGGWAWGQQQQPPPLPATTPAAAQATGGADAAGLAQGIRQAADPSRAVAEYTAAVARVGADVAVEGHGCRDDARPPQVPGQLSPSPPKYGSLPTHLYAASEPGDELIFQ